MKRDFLMISDLEADELHGVLAMAATLKQDRLQFHEALVGRSVGLFFERPSTRTRVSAEVATAELGAHPVALRGDEVGMGTREAPQDVARVLARYLSLVAMRVKSHAALEAVATHASIPVVNLLSERSHPCQALADLQTISEHRALPGTRLAYIGDGNNVAHSLLLGGAITGMEVVIAAPAGHEPSEEIVAQAESLAATHGGRIELTEDPVAAVTGSQVVYTDVWASMGQEDEAEHRLRAFAGFQVNEELFAHADDDALFLHCLPAHRGEEVADEMMEHRRSFVFDQAENRLHAFKALVLFLMDAGG